MKLGLSPCPNDTFIFYAMLHGKVDCEGLEFTAEFQDVETLNEMAFVNELPLTKLSFHAALHLQQKYLLLDSGAALGRGCGPLLIAKEFLNDEQLAQSLTGIPGNYTTAHLLLNLFYPIIEKKEVMVFSEIENSILKNKVKAGVIIHENRFTYEKKGLKKICDLGERWESETQTPIPLGGIFTRNDVPKKTHDAIERIIRRSVQYAWAHEEEVMQFVKLYSQEMEVEVIKQHINLYVNSFTESLGEVGHRAVFLLHKKWKELKQKKSTAA